MSVVRSEINGVALVRGRSYYKNEYAVFPIVEIPLVFVRLEISQSADMDYDILVRE